MEKGGMGGGGIHMGLTCSCPAGSTMREEKIALEDMMPSAAVIGATVRASSVQIEVLALKNE
jgi:hypothetical protein